MVEVDRLGEEIVGAQVHGLDRLVDAAVAGDDDHRDGQIATLHLLQKLDAVQARQAQVGQDQAVILVGQKPQRLFALGGGVHLELRVVLEQPLQFVAGELVVFHDQDAP